MSTVKAEIWGRRVPEGRLVLSREGEILTLQGEDEEPVRFIPLESFGQGVRFPLLAIRADYASALAASDRLDAEAVRALELELIELLTEMTPVARKLVERRHARIGGPALPPWWGWIVAGAAGGFLARIVLEIGERVIG